MASLIAQSTAKTTGLAYYGSGGRMLQTFTMSGYDTLEYVKLLLLEAGSAPGNLTLNLYATSGGKPTGSPLRSYSYTSATIGSIASYTWVTWNLTDITLTLGAVYALVLSQTSVSSTSNAWFWGHSTSASYSGGGSKYSTNSGSSWNSLSGDFAFQVYGSLSADPPTVTTDAVDTPTTSGFDADGTVSSDGGATVTERGFVYSSTNATPTTGDSKKTVAGTTGAYTATISGLLPGTLYYVRAYAINSQGTSYGAVLEITTDTTTPTVTTGAVSNVSSTGAVASGEVTDDGGAGVTERGVCWSTSSNPTTSDSKANSGTGKGSYSVNMTGLTAGTLYHRRAYAINAEGTVYGSDQTFTTLNQVKFWAQSFTANATGTLTKISLAVKLYSGVTGNLKVRIYSDNAGSPGTLLYTATTVQVTNTAYQYIDVTVNQAVTNTTKYWIVIEDPLVVGSYELAIGSNSAGGLANAEIKYTLTSAPTTWINTSHTSDDMAFSVYIQPAVTAPYNIEIRSRKLYK